MGDGWCQCRQLTLSPAPACDVAGRVVSQDGSRLWQNTQLDIAVEGSTLGQAQHGDVVTVGGKETACWRDRNFLQLSIGTSPPKPCIPTGSETSDFEEGGDSPSFKLEELRIWSLGYSVCNSSPCWLGLGMVASSYLQPRGVKLKKA